MNIANVAVACAAWQLLVVLPPNSAEAKAPLGRFFVKTASDGDVVLDKLFKLEWQRNLPDYSANYAKASAYCKGLQLQGGGWRLPDVRELQSLVDYKENQPQGPMIDLAVFPKTVGWFFWTTTPVKAVDVQKIGAYAVDFFQGCTSGWLLDSPLLIRCVR